MNRRLTQWLLNLQRRRQNTESSEMLEFLDADLPSLRSRFLETDFLVIDLETTSLEVQQGEIASIGWVPIIGGSIQLTGAEHYFLKINTSVGQSAAIHHIRDKELDSGLPIESIFTRFLKVATGKVFVFHNAELDMAFLNDIALRLYKTKLLIQLVDTLELERRKQLRQAPVLAPGALRLHHCRQRYHLPHYPAHDALTDALATAELFLAWAASTGRLESLRLNDCLC